MAILKIIGIVIFFWTNSKSFVLFAEDKYRAASGSYRIPEVELMGAAMKGGIGAFLAMQNCRHKTRKGAFPVLVPLFAAAQTVTILILLMA